MEKILIIANSLGLSVNGNSSYIDVLKKELADRFEVHPIVKSGIDIVQIVDILQCTEKIDEYSYIIIQIGTVECCPRPVTSKERLWISELKWKKLQSIIISVLKKYRPNIIKIRGLIQKVPIDIFGKKLNTALSLTKGINKVFLIGIFPTLKKNDDYSPGYNEQIFLYNTVLKKMPLICKNVSFIEPKDIIGDIDLNYFFSDGIHLSEVGVAQIVNTLKKCLNT